MAKRRKQGSGTVRKRSDGRWEARVVVDYDEKGLPKTKTAVAKTRRECMDKLKALIQQHPELIAELLKGTEKDSIKADKKV